MLSLVPSYLDRELAALDSRDKPSFQVLLWSLPIYFYAFYLLVRDGKFLMNLPVRTHLFN